jgi:hypothetical protein
LPKKLKINARHTVVMVIRTIRCTDQVISTYSKPSGSEGENDNQDQRKRLDGIQLGLIWNQSGTLPDGICQWGGEQKFEITQGDLKRFQPTLKTKGRKVGKGESRMYTKFQCTGRLESNQGFGSVGDRKRVLKRFALNFEREASTPVFA